MPDQYDGRSGYPSIDRILQRDVPASLEGRKALEAALEACVSILNDGLNRLKAPECEGRLEGIWCYEGANAMVVKSRVSSVCQIVHEMSDGTRRSVGTGALVDSTNRNRILTAGHVVPVEVAEGRTDAGRLLTVFGFEEECRGGQRGAMTEFPVTDIIEWFRTGLDYVVFRVGTNASGQEASSILASIPLGNPSTLTTGDELFCLQHPLGVAKQVSVGKFIGRMNALLEYDNLTNWQSSGAPVMDLTNGELMAVHNKPADREPCVRWGCAIDRIQAVSKELR